jgi:hypothetical protein
VTLGHSETPRLVQARPEGWATTDEGSAPAWRQLTPRHLVRHVGSKIRGTVTRDSDGWVAYLRLENPRGLSPITTVGQFDTVEAAMVAPDEMLASR